jgi:hypothetical protein
MIFQNSSRHQIYNNLHSCILRLKGGSRLEADEPEIVYVPGVLYPIGTEHDIAKYVVYYPTLRRYNALQRGIERNIASHFTPDLTNRIRCDILLGVVDTAVSRSLLRQTQQHGLAFPSREPRRLALRSPETSPGARRSYQRRSPGFLFALSLPVPLRFLHLHN